ncbi:unnamed protein product [Spodoptera littoralis]|uniref:Uncharacterized protein n=1 Tax=Spodoptera littoralis TaxID=7109 RepID=A0A9P0IDN8_SPOLI|nr:unnamed protein product [Spodoptera littoralis]CAH1645159.1 unnamed protein product [Spodoptera littoralis]
MPEEAKLESILFNYETTYKGSYTDGSVEKSMRDRMPDNKGEKIIKKPRERPPFVPLKDLESLTPWKDHNVPFTLYHKPKEILQTNPRNMQERFDRFVDEERATVQKTRPKVLMTPAYHLDSIPEPDREVVINSMYKSETAYSLEDALKRTKADNKSVKSPLPGVYSKCNPVKNELEPLLPPYVSPEWRRDSVFWDNKQLRTHADATKHFWLSREPPNCLACNATALYRRLNKKYV